jgi:2-polyprenyl-6-methoxyphenol hydroxylase-like FAD-dependent oxidoreductase
MPQDLVAALRRYEQLRMPRAHRTVLGSRARAKMNHMASPWGRFKRNVGLAVRQRFGIDKTAFQADWLYAYDVAAEADPQRHVA